MSTVVLRGARALVVGVTAWSAWAAAGRASGQLPLVRWGQAALTQPADWYSSAEARLMADRVMEYQSPEGGWPKNTDLAVPLTSAEARAAAHSGPDANTIDNDATTTPVRFIALVGQATGESRYRQAVNRGVDYLLAAQYPNGGWPQYFPLREGYYSRITFNDDAMINVLEVLRDVRDRMAPFAFVDEPRRVRASAAVERGLEIILRTQVRQNGRLTSWCAQYDETTLAPAWARNYEPPTLSGNESVGIVRHLMRVERPTHEILAAVEGAVAWFHAVALHGLRVEEFTGADGSRDRRVVADPEAPPLWARFYDLRTNQPVFTGRDKVMRRALGEIEHERRIGYAYYGTWPATVIAEEYPRWRERHRLERPAR